MLSKSTMCVHCIGFPSVPDRGGVRFCTHCEDFVPLAKFQSGGPRRYVCKFHMYIASGQRSSKKMLSDPQKRALHQLWGRAFKDSKLFKQPRIAITQAEIAKILAFAAPGGVGKSGVLYAAKVFAIVPSDPTKALSAANSALVSTSTRSLLMRQWKLFGKEGYCEHLTGGNGSAGANSERTPEPLPHTV